MNPLQNTHSASLPFYFGISLLVLGVLLLTAAGMEYLARQSFLHAAVKTTGTIIEYTTSGDMERPVVVFPDEKGEEHHFTSRIGTANPQHTVGSQVSILYDPNDPANAELEENLGFPLITTGIAILGLGTLLFGFIMMKYRES